jgi:hypothetical protein
MDSKDYEGVCHLLPMYEIKQMISVAISGRTEGIVVVAEIVEKLTM